MLIFLSVINKTDYSSRDMATTEFLEVTEQDMKEGTGN